MSIVKRASGELMFFNAIPLADDALEEVRAWGKPSILVVPHHQHMIDGHAFREKLGLKLYGSPECAEEIKKRAALTGTLDAIPPDDDVQVHHSQGNKLGEPVIEVRSDGGSKVSLIFGDLIQNNAPESVNLMFRMMGFGGEPKVVPMFKLMFVKDKARTRDQLVRWSEIKGLSRLLPSHGNLVAQVENDQQKGPAALLRSAAETV